MNKNITPFNDKKQRHGYWELYRTNDNIWYKIYYKNGKPSDYEEYYYNENPVVLKFYL